MSSPSFDVLIIGAGVSAINGAYRLQTEFPHCRYAILEARNNIGGTWDLFRYPGIRLNSDLYTFDFQWFPWNQPNPIAEGGGYPEHIRLNHRVNAAKWGGHQWSLDVESEDTSQELSARFIIFATGYYDYRMPMEAVIPGLQRFNGETIHPQFWPEKFDSHDREIVVIGSGATAVTLVPSLGENAESVTMLQRSPSYFASLPNAPADSTWAMFLPKRALYSTSTAVPGSVKAQLLPGAALDPDFKPRYNPWDQRLCLCPDGDFFRALRSTKAKVETGIIETVDEGGIQLTSGKRLDADVIITATGLRMRLFGGIPIYVNGEKLEFSQNYMWNGLMLQDLPNAAIVLGFVNASWTLGADLAMCLTCRILKHMESKGYSTAVPILQNQRQLINKATMELTSTYIKRAAKELPRTSQQRPWVSRTSYFSDLYFALFGDIKKGLVFSS